MKRKTLIIIISCFMVSILTIAVLFVISEDLTHSHNSFNRLFPPHPLREGKILDIKFNSYYIAGATNHNIYLANYTAPFHLLVLNETLADSQHVKMTIKDIKDLKFWSIRVKVDSPNFYITDGTIPRMFTGNVLNWTAQRYKYDSAYYVDSVPISSTSYVIKSLSNVTKEHVLGKVSTDVPHVKFKPGLLQKQIDGIFCTDGMMHYDKALERLVYVYLYRNQYFVMDTNLNLDYRGKTIDDISKAQIKVASISSDNSYTMSAPPLMVNKRSCVSGKLLFINSNQLAKNEDRNTFDKASVIDVYDLEKGKYKFSFHLFDIQGKKMQTFQVVGDNLIALFDQYVVQYELIPKYFQN